MRSYGVEINKGNYKLKSTRELEHALITCDAEMEDSIFGTDIFRINKLKEIQELKPLVEKRAKVKKTLKGRGRKADV